MKKFVAPLITALLFIAVSSSAQVKKQQAKVYTSTTQKIIKGVLADATEEIVQNKVVIKVLLNKYEFIYPNHEREDISVTMTQSEWMEGVKEEDYQISNHPTVKGIYFMRDKNKIWLDLKNGETIFYTILIPKKSASKK